MSRGRPSVEQRLAALRRDLGNLDDLVALEEGGLARMPCFQRAAERHYRGRTCALGLAIAEELRAFLRQAALDLTGTPISALASCLAEGRLQVEAAEAVGISPQQLSRRYKPVLLALLQKHLDRLAEGGGAAGIAPRRLPVAVAGSETRGMAVPMTTT